MSTVTAVTTKTVHMKMMDTDKMERGLKPGDKISFKKDELVTFAGKGGEKILIKRWDSTEEKDAEKVQAAESLYLPGMRSDINSTQPYAAAFACAFGCEGAKVSSYVDGETTYELI